jgi:GntR family transcriptional regulator
VDVPLESRSPLPLYYQLERALRERIRRGELRRGTPIPGEMELAEEFGVSRGTIRQALDRLVRAGLIVRERGRGSFVAGAPIEYPMGRFYSFAHEMAERGIAESSKVLAQAQARAPGSVARALGLGAGRAAVRIVRLRFAGEDPLLLETSYLPKDLGASLLRADLTHGSIYDVLERDGVRVTGMTEQVRPVVLGARHASTLRVPEGSPAFAVERVVTAGDDPVEWRLTLAPGSRVTLTAEWGSR